jgi:hypothetical protein
MSFNPVILAAALHAVRASLQGSMGVGPRPLRKCVFATRAHFLCPCETAPLLMPGGIMRTSYSVDHKITTASVVDVVAV